MNSDYSQTANPKDELAVFTEVKRHSDIGFNETQRRAIGKNRVGSISFNEADELFRGWIDENNWPYEALMFDPRIQTFIFEKTSRLIAAKPRGHLTPRQSGDILSAKINNAILDSQWDLANNGGSMISKWSIMDMNTRKYGSAFALVKWRYEERDGQVLFDGPEMKVLNNRDCAHDLTATAIEDCHWFQVREYPAFQDLLRVNDSAKKAPYYKNMDKLREAISRGPVAGGDFRGSNWTSRNRSISRLEIDPTGQDYVYKTVEIVTEYRKDRWITFAPRHGLILRDIPNPYNNNEIPIIMLRYLAIDDDLYGLSEIESIKSLQKAINALLSQYLDEINMKLYTPIATGPGVRQHTLEWGKGARWQMNNPMTDFRLVEPSSNSAALFQPTYSVLVSAMQNALGETSLGVSNMRPFSQEKTATEVKSIMRQMNVRDNFNQIFLSEAIQRLMRLWYSMNQKFLFADPNKKHYLLRVVGKDLIRKFQEQGLDDMILPDTALTDMLNQGEEDAERFKTPRFGVNIGTGKKSKLVPKLKLNPDGSSGELLVEPKDIQGVFDFIADVKPMAANYDDQKKQARQAAISLLVSNPNVIALLAQEQVKPKFKELFIDWLEDMGFQDANKYFEDITGMGMSMPNGSPVQGLPSPTPSPRGGIMGGSPDGGSMAEELKAISPLDRNANVVSQFSKFGVGGEF